MVDTINKTVSLKEWDFATTEQRSKWIADGYAWDKESEEEYTRQTTLMFDHYLGNTRRYRNA